jgi:probable F420-dependent oxidoreductase
MDAVKLGLMLPLGDEESGGFANLEGMALEAEASGLDSVWGADHLVFVNEEGVHGIHECWTVLTAVAAITSRVEIGPLVLALPFRNPALLAKMAAELDEVSGGRLILGIGCGWHEPEFDAFGYPFDHRVSRFEEAVQILGPMLRGERVTFSGRFHAADGAELRPRPVREGGPPILIAARRPRMLRLAARHATQWNAAWFGDPRGADGGPLRTRLADLDAALADVGRDPATMERTAGILVAFEEADADAPEEAIRGSTAEMARALAGYAELGVAHVIAHIYPRTPAAVARYAEAAAGARELLA